MEDCGGWGGVEVGGGWGVGGGGGGVRQWTNPITGVPACTPVYKSPVASPFY